VVYTNKLIINKTSLVATAAGGHVEIVKTVDP
jgi:hypothetical protein